MTTATLEKVIKKAKSIKGFSKTEKKVVCHILEIELKKQLEAEDTEIAAKLREAEDAERRGEYEIFETVEDMIESVKKEGERLYKLRNKVKKC